MFWGNVFIYFLQQVLNVDIDIRVVFVKSKLLSDRTARIVIAAAVQIGYYLLTSKSDRVQTAVSDLQVSKSLFL